jgi:hypothetical protein
MRAMTHVRFASSRAMAYRPMAALTAPGLGLLAAMVMTQNLA